MRPMVANYIPSGSKYQEPLLHQENLESSHFTVTALGQLSQDSATVGNQQHQQPRAQSTPNSMTSACHASLLQESYSTRYNSGVSSAKESSEDENMQESNNS